MSSFWPQFLDQLPLVLLALVFARLSLLLSWPGFLWLEKKYPAREHTPGSNYLENWLITTVTVFLSPVFAAAVIVATLAFTQWLDFPRLVLPALGELTGIAALDVTLNAVLIFLGACLLGDFSYYWWHRLQHTVPFLWEIHKLHHSDEFLNTTTIYRAHFLEPAGQALLRGLTVGLVFDFSESPQTAVALVFGALLPVLWDYFIHANVKLDGFSRLLPYFSSPQFHWIHHSRLPQHQDKNFAIWLPLYDVLFGSYYKPEPGEYPPTGLSSGEKIDSIWHGQADPLRVWVTWWRR